MKYVMIFLCIVFFTMPIYLISRYGIKRKDVKEYVEIEK